MPSRTTVEVEADQPPARPLPAGIIRRILGRDRQLPCVGREFLQPPSAKAVLHITHWKAGSQWIRRLLEEAFGPAIEPPEIHCAHIFSQSVQPGRVYPCLYMNKHEHDCLSLSQRAQTFVIIRDLRDALVSGYFSWRYTHRIEWFPMEKSRRVLNTLSKEAGLLYMLDEFLPKLALIQRSWLEAGVRCWKLEDFMAEPVIRMEQLLRDELGVAVERSYIDALIARNSFNQLSGGRAAGQEDLASHYRKGVAGDWKSHFTPAIKDRFKQHYNDLLKLAGYENGDCW